MISLIGETKKNNAFTLIEILLVITIIGIILALATPNFSKGYSRFQLNKTADDLLECSRWAQAMAIGQERTYALFLDSEHRSYKLMRVKNDDENRGQDDFEPVNGALGRMHKLPDAIRLVITQPYGSKGTGDMERIEFHPDGNIDPATIQLSSSGQKTVLSSTQMRGMMAKINDE